MFRQLTIVGLRHEEETGRRIGNLASFAGAEPKEWAWFSADSEGGRIAEILRTGKNAIAISSRALRQIQSAFPEWSRGRSCADTSRRKVVIYGLDGSSAEADFLREVTQGRVTGAKPWDPPGAICTVDPHSRQIFGPIAGLDIPIEHAASLCTFSIAEGADSTECLMRVAGKPLFVRVSIEPTEIFLLGTEEVPDIDSCVPFDEDASLLPRFFTLMPWLASIRHLLAERSWANDSPRACLILDDPLLRERYGYLSYQALLDCMRLRRFCTSIGFIPWNFRRTRQKVADLFLRYPESYSLSVHGCDHTNGEFSESDMGRMRELTARAMERMVRHERLHGIPFDRVMVFPQAEFSVTAMSALKSASYLAAVNSTQYAIDSTLTLRELLEVAVTRFSNFPVFIRRYPKNLADLAFDLFLGKPALLVEHHDYFRDGYDALAEFVDKLNALDSRLEWTNLAQICSRASLRRVAENGDVHVRFYTDRFWLQNETDRPQRYVLFRRQAPEESIACITVNGQGADFGQEAGWLRVPLALEPREAAGIRVEHGEANPETIPSAPSFTYNTKVLVRRVLSEVRDNHPGANWFLSRVVSAARSYRARKKHRPLKA